MVYRSCMPLKKTPLSIKPLDKLNSQSSIDIKLQVHRRNFRKLTSK